MYVRQVNHRKEECLAWQLPPRSQPLLGRGDDDLDSIVAETVVISESEGESEDIPEPLVLLLVLVTY